jgi:hypothetical protein
MNIDMDNKCEICKHLGKRKIKVHPKTGAEIHCIKSYITVFEMVKHCPYFEKVEK